MLQAEAPREKASTRDNEADSGAWVRAIGSEAMRITTLNGWPVGQRGAKPQRLDLAQEVERRSNGTCAKMVRNAARYESTNVRETNRPL